MSERVKLYELEFDELTEWLAEMGQPAFRARQIWQWLYVHFAADFSEMTNLSLDLREKLAQTALKNNMTLPMRTTSASCSCPSTVIVCW
jgi:23S rRNA (adenine2503-C2)-methyltransferase